VPFLHVTTRIEDRPHDDLLSEKADRLLFPTVVYMDAEGEPLTVVTDLHTVPEYEAILATAQRYLVLRGKRDGGDPGVATELAILECELGRIDVDDLEADLEEAELTADQQARVARLRVNVAVRVRFLIVRKQRHSAESLKAATEEFLEILEKGPVPDPGGDEETFFWRLLWRHGMEARDVAFMERVLDLVRPRITASGDPDAAETLARMEKDLADAKEDR